jgi:hypothetical protein
MEPVTPGARHIGMTPRQMRRGLAVAAAWGLLGVALAGCGSVVASSGAPTPGAATTAGCASVNQANKVTVSRIIHVVLPRSGGPLVFTDSTPAQVHALFQDFCRAVTHPEVRSGGMYCPAGLGTEYAGVFYDGSRVLARYAYVASGCGLVDIIVGSTTRSTMLAGPAAAAAPHLAADFAAVLDSAKRGLMPPSELSPGGPNQAA